MRRLGIALLLALSPLAAIAQEPLTTSQRNADLAELASQYAKNYAPYE